MSPADLILLAGGVGPIMIPFFLTYGLAKGTLIGTEALATVVMQVTNWSPTAAPRF
jgi:hypothetical protein